MILQSTLTKTIAFLTPSCAAIAAAALLGSGASAQAQVAGVRSIDISEIFPIEENTFGIALAEVLAFESLNGTGTNFALDTNLGSSTTPAGFGSSATDAIDGNPDGAFGNGSVWHELENQGNLLNTYTVTFDSEVTLGSVEVFGRTDCCKERDGNESISNLRLTLRDASGGELFATDFGIPNDDQQILISTVPEPSAALVLGGLGAISALLRPRRSR